MPNFFFQKLKLGLYLLLNTIWAIPVLLLVRLIRPFVFVKFGTFNSHRIGHFAADAGQKFADKQINKNNFITLYWLPKKCSNDFWASLVKRNFFVKNWVYPLDFWNKRLPFGSAHSENSTDTRSRDIYGVQESLAYSMTFSVSENEVAKKWLKNLGWSEGEPFACLLVRDSAYLKNLFGSSKDLSYHDYRDSDVSSYIKAAEWLASKGVWVLRMGKAMNEPIKSAHPMVVDYAFHDKKNDFMDVWLFANCNLCISTGSGPDMISDVYRRPTLFLNYIPIARLVSWSNALHTPKIMRWKDCNQKFTLSDYIQHAYMETGEYLNNNIDIVNLNPDQILESVKEMWERYLGNYKDYDEWVLLNQNFFNVLKQLEDYNQLHGYIHPNAGISLWWLKDQIISNG